jgi:lysyl-tRNA synthetase class 2
MTDCAHLLALAAETCGAKRIAWRGAELDPFAEPERLGVIEAFARHAKIDLAATLGPGGETDREALARQIEAHGASAAADDTWSDLFSKVLATEIEPKLGQGRATFLCDYPAAEAALARRKPGDPRLSERFELYACGVELANAFGELTDPIEQRRRFVAEMDEKARVYGERYPIDEDFLAALAHMPPAAGAALGFDRLVMLAAGARRIEDVLWTPVP